MANPFCDIATRGEPNGSLASLLERRHFDASMTVRGDATRLRDALVGRKGIVLTAIGASNTVRGGCLPSQGTYPEIQCRDPRYTTNSTGWLLQVFNFMNRTWPNANNKLINNARFATGPSFFASLVDRSVPMSTTLLIIAFGEMCERHVATNEDDRGLDSKDSKAVQKIIRSVRERSSPPTILLWNQHNWHHSCAPACRYTNGCDRIFTPIGQYYSVPSVSMKHALYFDALCGQSPLFYRRWTLDGGLHLDLAEGDKIVAALISHWIWEVTQVPRGAVAPQVSLRLSALGSSQGLLERTHERQAGASTLSFSFDAHFAGTETRGHRSSHSTSEFPLLASSTRCQFEKYVNASHGVVQKQGYLCMQPDECLHVNTTAVGVSAVRVGYVAGPRTRAVATLTCLGGCHCKSQTISAYREEYTLLEEADVQVSSSKSRLPPHCIIGMCPTTRGERFKFVSLTVTVASAVANITMLYSSRLDPEHGGQSIGALLRKKRMPAYEPLFEEAKVDLASLCSLYTNRTSARPFEALVGAKLAEIGITVRPGPRAAGNSYSIPRKTLSKAVVETCTPPSAEPQELPGASYNGKKGSLALGSDNKVRHLGW